MAVEFNDAAIAWTELWIMEAMATLALDIRASDTFKG